MEGLNAMPMLLLSILLVSVLGSGMDKIVFHYRRKPADCLR